MKNFKDLGIRTIVKTFTGEKIPMRKLFDKQIVVHDYKIEPSIKKIGTDRLQLQISLNDKKHVVFTGSIYLMDAIQKVPKSDFPFQTTIVEEEKMFVFT